VMFPPAACLREGGKDRLGAVPAGADIVGVRPDSITFEKPSGASLKLDAPLELVEPVGGESHLHLRLAGSDQLIVMEVAGRPAVEEGANHAIYARASAFHCFEQQTGRRVD